MKITVCDLEPVVTSAHHFRPSVEACPNQANVSFAVGDFFKPETIPKAELYVLSHVLHNWSEDKVDLILSNVYKCLPSGNFNRKKVLPFFKGSSTHVRKYVRAPSRAIIKSKQKILRSANSDQKNGVYYLSGLIRDWESIKDYSSSRKAVNDQCEWNPTHERQNSWLSDGKTLNTPILKSNLTRNAVTALQWFPSWIVTKTNFNFEFTVLVKWARELTDEEVLW